MTEFVLEAKVGPNRWIEISDIYKEIKISSKYQSEEEALTAKGNLKWALSGVWKGAYKKYPIRVSKL